jgi:predicted TIM-barrel fold metal-dependent hydrolase
MNERITKIVIDLLGKEGVVNSRAFGHWALSDEELEKFAELIIRECISKISTEQDFADQNWQCKSGIHITHELMKHFGVEE